MLRHIEAAALVAVLPISSAIAATPVSFDELTKHPQHYNGRIVEVTAWLQVDTADTIASLRPRPHVEMSDLPEIFVDCPRWLSDARIYASADHRVRITGRFEYRKLTRKLISPARGNTPGIEELTRGFGWMGIFDKQLTNVSEFTVLR
jgi:hypothetical protein